MKPGRAGARYWRSCVNASCGWTRPSAASALPRGAWPSPPKRLRPPPGPLTLLGPPLHRRRPSFSCVCPQTPPVAWRVRPDRRAMKRDVRLRPNSGCEKRKRGSGTRRQRNNASSAAWQIGPPRVNKRSPCRCLRQCRRLRAAHAAERQALARASAGERWRAGYFSGSIRASASDRLSPPPRARWRALLISISLASRGGSACRMAPISFGVK